jgi:hypothetical protein
VNIRLGRWPKGGTRQKNLIVRSQFAPGTPTVS